MATIRRRGSKWQVQIRRKGLRPMARTFHASKDAETWARQMEVLADQGDLLPDARVLERVTLGDLVKRYRDTVSVSKRDHASERYILTAFLGHPMCSKRLSQVHTEDFATYRDQRLKDIKPTSLKRQLAPIHHLFELARDEWGLPLRTNPLDKLQLKAPSQKRERRLRPGELDRLMDASSNLKNPLITPIIQFALATGMRRGEILAVERRHIDWERRSLLIPDTKNGHSRTIPLTNEAIALLQVVRGDRDRLFPITANCLRLAWERLKRRAGIDDLHFHDLRHEAISRFFEVGLTVPEVALISGHRDMRMLFRYTHPLRERILEKLTP